MLIKGLLHPSEILLVSLPNPDFGQVSVDSFDVPVDDLKFSLGFGLFYITPVGPILLDLGFPLDPPHGDQSWQVHFSIGQFF